MKVLITGASGFLGSFIVKEAVARGHDVAALAGDAPERLPASIEIVPGDVADPTSLDRAMLGRDALIHADGFVSFRSADRRQLFERHVNGSENVFAAAGRAKIRRVVYASSVATMGASQQPQILDETAPPDQLATKCAYHESKWQAELRALAHVEAGVPIVILNHGMILGPDDFAVSSTRLVLHFLNRTIPGFAEGGFSVVHVRDCAEAFVTALDRGVVGERYILAGLNTTLSDFFVMLSRLSGVAAPRRLPRWLPYAVASIADAAVWALPPLARTRVAEMNRPTIRASLQYTFYTPKKAEAALDFRLTPLEQTLQETVDSLYAQGLVQKR